MIIKKKICKNLRNNEEGAVLIEFAFVAPIFFLILMGVFDFGYSIYARSVLNGAVQTAARNSALEVATQNTDVDNGDGTTTTVANSDLIDERFRNAIEDVVPFGTISIDRKSYFDFFDVERAEVFTDSDGNGVCNDSEPYTDENNNGEWDEDVGVDGIGGPRDVVLLEVELAYSRIFPLYRFIGSTNVQNIKATTVLRNQPYAQQVDNRSTERDVCV